MKMKTFNIPSGKEIDAGKLRRFPKSSNVPERVLRREKQGQEPHS